MTIPKYPAAWCQNNPTRAAQLLQSQEETIQRLYQHRLDDHKSRQASEALAIAGALGELQMQIAHAANATTVGAIQRKREKFMKIATRVSHED